MVQEPNQSAPLPVNPENFIPRPEIRPPQPEGEFEVPAPVEQVEQRSFVPTPEAEGPIDKSISALKQKIKSKKNKPITVPRVKDEITLRIEGVMEEGLQDAFKELTPVQQQEFKIKGEETAWQIRELLRHASLKVKQIFKLLLEWLKFLPGINKYFLEQEAKIKADKIISLKRLQ